MTTERMCGFGYKIGWLAVRDASVAQVFAALGCQDAGPVGWLAGVDQAYESEDLVAATPPLGGGWTLVLGRWVMSWADQLDVAALSATLDREVQLYASHRVVELHRWDRAVDGTLIRSFEYLGESGEVLRWEGAPDDVERAVGLPPVLADDDFLIVDEDDVMRVAGSWSVDPTSLEGQPAPGPLMLGRFPPDQRAPRPPSPTPAKAVSVTDLIISGMPIDEVNAHGAASARGRPGLAGQVTRPRPRVG